jgi:hypothetical protein
MGVADSGTLDSFQTSIENAIIETNANFKGESTYLAEKADIFREKVIATPVVLLTSNVSAVAVNAWLAAEIKPNKTTKDIRRNRALVAMMNSARNPLLQ